VIRAASLVDLEATMTTRFMLLLATILLTAGCSTFNKAASYIPSFWDDNQSAAIIDVRQSIKNLDCEKPHLDQAYAIQQQIQWFRLYSESKGARQKDVLDLTEPLHQTAEDFYNRSKEQQGSVYYCEAKKSVLDIQASKAAEAVMRRF